MGGKPAKKYFSKLCEMKEEIENEIGPLIWMELPDKTACRIIVYHDGDIKNKSQWPDLYNWLGEKAEAFHLAFSKRAKKISTEQE
jgi:hypothetical protein